MSLNRLLKNADSSFCSPRTRGYGELGMTKNRELDGAAEAAPMVDLPKLIAKFRAVNNRESDVAFFHTHVPWVAPDAYLNIIFKPAAGEVLSDVGAKIRMPAPVLELLARHNGAKLLSGSLSLYGVVRHGQLLNRSDPFSLPPFNIEFENQSWPPPDRDRFLKIGGYGFDGSGVCIDRHNLHIGVFRRGGSDPYCSWPSLDVWLNSEIKRLSELFDPSGKRLVEGSQTLPSPTTDVPGIRPS